MNPETFILRKKFLEEFYKEHVNFTFEKDIIKSENEDYINKILTYETNVFYPETFNLGFLKRIIPFIFYLNSLYGCNLNDDIMDMIQKFFLMMILIQNTYYLHCFYLNIILTICHI